MHRKKQFDDLVKQWLELDLDQTCVALDNYNSVRIAKSVTTAGQNLVFTHRVKGNSSELTQVQIQDANIAITNQLALSTPEFALMLFGLEKAIETY